MTRGLLAPLSPHEEIALRRVAYGSAVIDTRVAAVLCRLALIERTAAGFRLTPLGRQRYDALPKALLQVRHPSLHAVTGYVEGLLEKAQLRVQAQRTESSSESPRPSTVRAEAALDRIVPTRGHNATGGDGKPSTSIE